MPTTTERVREATTKIHSAIRDFLALSFEEDDVLGSREHLGTLSEIYACLQVAATLSEGTTAILEFRDATKPMQALTTEDIMSDPDLVRRVMELDIQAKKLERMPKKITESLATANRDNPFVGIMINKYGEDLGAPKGTFRHMLSGSIQVNSGASTKVKSTSNINDMLTKLKISTSGK